jgi:hypothetical protein
MCQALKSSFTLGDFEMKVYMVEWWDEMSMKYQQEYYTSINMLAMRVTMLEADVPLSDVSVSTLSVCTDE